MEVRSLLRPMSSLTSLHTTTITTATATTAATCCVARITARRQQSTTSRTKKALKIAPHPSFLTQSPSRGANHIVFNPPAAAPSVYHTPFIFLPKTDPRRQANLSQLLLRSHSSPASPSSTSETTPPPTLTASEEARSNPKYNVTKEQVEEMRALRAEDPERWSVLKLAARYGCTNWFVMMCCNAPQEHKERERERKEAIRARWGPIRTQAREERKKRKALLLRDEL